MSAQRAPAVHASVARSVLSGVPGGSIKIVSWNLLHRNGATLDAVAQLVERERPELLLMQEATEHMDGLPLRVGGHYARSPLPGRTHGLAAWGPCAFATTPAALHLPRGVLIRRLCQIVRLEHFTIANVHLSHGQLLNRRQLRRIARALPERAAVVGDCNLIGPPMLRGFRDVGPRLATHAAGGVLPLRLDRCFVRGLRCEGADVLPAGASDHRPIVVRLALAADG